MKDLCLKSTRPLLVLCVITIFSFKGFSQVGINTTDPHPSSILEINSDDKGILIPRLSKIDRVDMVDPAYSLMVYDTNSQSFWYFKQGSITPDLDRWEEIGKNSLKTVVKYQDPNGRTLGANLGLQDPLLANYYQLMFSEQVIDKNNEFDPATSIFTSAQDGIYSIYLQGMFRLEATREIAVGIFRKDAATNVVNLIAEGCYSSSSGVAMRSTHTIVPLKKGDQIYFGTYTNPQNRIFPLNNIKTPQTQFTITQID